MSVNPVSANRHLENGHLCQYDDSKIDALVRTNQEVSNDIGILVTKIDTIVEHNRTFFRYMLIVICVIALGDKGIDLAERFWGRNAQKMEISTPDAR